MQSITKKMGEMALAVVESTWLDNFLLSWENFSITSGSWTIWYDREQDRYYAQCGEMVFEHSDIRNIVSRIDEVIQREFYEENTENEV